MAGRIFTERLLFITDFYRVHDWPAFEALMAKQPELKGNRDDGWGKLFEDTDGETRRSLLIVSAERAGRIDVSYRTQKYADEGLRWFEGLVGTFVSYITCEISDLVGAVKQGASANTKK